MKVCPRGIVLVEVIAYLGIASLLSLLCITLMLRMHESIFLSHGTGIVREQCDLAHDLLARDIRTAPRDPLAWKAREAQRIVWSDTTHDIGWEYDKKKLTRTTGLYHAHAAQWEKPSRKTIVKHLDTCEFTVHTLAYPVRITHIDFTLGTSEYVKKAQYYLRKRVII